MSRSKVQGSRFKERAYRVVNQKLSVPFFPLRMKNSETETNIRQLGPMNHEDPDRPRLVIITGPTAVGKSGLGHGLAREMGGEIINADSMQVYRSMDIGTAKPTPTERREVPYHLIDIIHPDQPFDASEFRIRAQAVIQELHLRQVPDFRHRGDRFIS